jgi:hemin uptake protein HemP
MVDVMNENRYRSQMVNDPPKPKPPMPEANDRSLRIQEGRVTSEDLLGERGELIIEHQGRQYRLRLTQNGKLILTA